MLKEGITLMHEHVYIDLSHLKNDDAKLDDFENLVTEYKELYKNGVRNIVDVTNFSMGRNFDYMREVAKVTNMNILYSTGYYQDRFLPDNFNDLSVDNLVEIMLNDIKENNTSLIAEIGTSNGLITRNEEKLFIASAKVSNLTGLPISTHCTMGTMALEQIKILADNEVDLSRVIVGHTDLICKMDYFYQILDTGANIQFDTIGKNNYKDDKYRIECLKLLENSPYESNIFISMDITRKSHLKLNGGIGFNYLFDVFIPNCLDAGISKRFLDKIMIENPRRFFKGE